MLHAKFQDHRASGSREDFKVFYRAGPRDVVAGGGGGTES